MTITRRWFLLGTAAALATTKLTLPKVIEPEAAVSRLTLSTTNLAILKDILIVGNETQSRAVNLSIFRPDLLDQGPLLNFRMNAFGGIIRWIAMPDNEIAITPNKTIGFRFGPDPGDCTLQLIYTELNGDYRRINVEIFEHKNGDLFSHRRNFIQPNEAWTHKDDFVQLDGSDLEEWSEDPEEEPT